MDVTRQSAIALARMIRAGEVSAREVVEAHIDQLRRRPWLNALSEPRYEKACAEADVVDARISVARADDRLPPLLGVPITVKSSLAITGMSQAGGVPGRREVQAHDTAPAVARVLGAGAILLGTSNLAELSLAWESRNRLHGHVSSAYGPLRTAGGSSGGCGAAVGVGGSALGIGSDIGGSVRVPAYFNGVFGHKPTRGLVPTTGHFPVGTGRANEFLALGPITRRAEDLMPALRLLAGHDPTDSVSRPYALADPAEIDLTGFPVLIAEDMTRLPVRRDIMLAQERAAAALSALGCAVSPISLKSLRRAWEYFLAALHTEYGPSVAELLTGDPRASLPKLLHGRDHMTQTLLVILSERAHLRFPRYSAHLVDAGRRMSDELATTVGDAALIHPSFLRLAPRHATTIGQIWLIGPLVTFNMAGMPATQVPLGRNSQGLPTGVQIAAGLGRDHVTIRLAMELEQALGGWSPPEL